MARIKITYPEGTPLHPLYYQYDGQTNVQPAYVELDLTADPPTLSAGYSGEIGGGVPMAVWHNRCLRWAVMPNLTAAEIRTLLDTLAPLAERVANGYEDAWDGSNTLGRFSEDAEYARYRAACACRDVLTESGGVWDASDWLNALGRAGTIADYGITALSTDDDLEEIGKQMEGEALDQDISIIYTMAHLESLRQDCIDAAE